MKRNKEIFAWEEKMHEKAERIKYKALRTVKRTWRPRTALVVVFFILATFVPVLGGCSSNSGQQQLPQVDSTPSTASLHEGKIEELKALLERAESTPPAELRAGLSSARQDLDSLNATMEEEFAGTTEVLNRLDLPDKMQIHEEVMAKFAGSKDRLNASLEETVASSDTDIYTETASLYGLACELCPEEESQPLGAELPNQLIERDPVAPVLGANIAPAYMHGAPGLTPSDLPVEPTPEDLAPTIDAQHSQEIIDKAAELENDPVKIYEWVRNNIDFEPYYGSKKGATETLAEMAGNDMDTASLLIALYRVSGIPARYVTGVIEITADQAMAWTATAVPEAALRLFASGGTPITGIQEGGVITRFQLTHTFIEAYLNYSNYRGATGGEGPSEWIPIDASYKAYVYDYGAREEISDNLGLSNLNWLFDASGIQTSGCFFSGIDTTLQQSMINDIYTEGTDYINDLADDSTLVDIIGELRIIPEMLNYIPSSPPFLCLSMLEEVESVGQNDRYKLSVSIQDCNMMIEIPALEKRDVVIYFSPANDEDRRLVGSFNTLAKTPAYLISVIPRLFIDGQEMFNGSICKFSELINIGISVTSPSGKIGNSVNRYPAAGTYSIVLSTGNAAASIYSNIAMLDEYNSLPSFQASSGIQSTIGYTYFSLYEKYLDVLVPQRDGRRFGEASWGTFTTSYELNVCYGIPILVTPKSLFMDVGNMTSVVVSNSNDMNNEKAISIFSGFIGSSLESDVYEILFGVEAVSTAEIMIRAIQNEEQFAAIMKDTPYNEIEMLTIPEGVLQNIKNQANEGKLVVIPTTATNIDQWSGTGWIAIDLKSGSSGFYISESIAGGSIASELSIINSYVENLAGKALASSTASLSLDEGDVEEVLSEMEVPVIVKEFLQSNALTFISAIYHMVRLTVELVKGGVSIKDALLFASDGICIALLSVFNIFVLVALKIQIAKAFAPNAPGMQILAAGVCAWFATVVMTGTFLLKGLLLRAMIEEAGR